jgi:hypothetical protein
MQEKLSDDPLLKLRLVMDRVQGHPIRNLRDIP